MVVITVFSSIFALVLFCMAVATACAAFNEEYDSSGVHFAAWITIILFVISCSFVGVAARTAEISHNNSRLERVLDHEFCSNLAEKP